MAAPSKEILLMFPTGFPEVTAGALLDNNTFISGHQNGFIVKWNLTTKAYSIIFVGNSSVTAIACTNGNKIVVAFFSGALFVFEHTKKGLVSKELRQPKYDVNSRIWKLAWVDSNNFLVGSTYGELTPFRQVDDSWSEDYYALKGHQHSIFGIASVNGKYIATGDYFGVVLIWKFDGKDYTVIQKIGILGTVEDIFWQNNDRLSIITKSGRVYVLERDSKEPEKWQAVLEVNAAWDRGISVKITDDGKLVYAGSLSRLIKIDLDSYQAESLPMNTIKSVFATENAVIVLDLNGLISIKNQPVEITAKVISYKFIKISLLGYTGTGKTTFCSNLVNGSIDNIYSTFGKRIFTWKANDGGVEEKIFFHDHGGQETTLETFIPQVLDSDIILIFYRKTDNGTFIKAMEILKQIRKKIGEDVAVFFVETFIDHDLNDIPEGSRERLLENKIISGIVKVSPKANTGFNEFENLVLKKIDWAKARKMVQSPFIQGISSTLSLLHDEKSEVVLFEVFREIYENKIINKKISERHLKFLLEDFSNQGIIEYYPKISDLIILDDKQFNKMQTDVPKFAAEKGGKVTIEELASNFKNEEYLRILDEMYFQSGVTIRNGRNRIFPRMLADSFALQDGFIESLSKTKQETLNVKYQEIEIGRLIEQLSELNLQCLNISKREGLFAWEDNAYVYYFWQEARTSIFSKNIQFTYCVAGKKPAIVDRLKKEFLACIQRAFGPLIDEVLEGEKSDKKKFKEYEFAVALSFAGEQRQYVEELANILKNKGLEVFYDKFKQSQLWGRNLVEYFREVYYSRSRFCIMFISTAYLEKMWPAHERRNATARDLEEFGEYILPIIFEDNLNVPGLDRYRGYLDARKYSPQQVAEIFLQKMKSDEDQV